MRFKVRDLLFVLLLTSGLASGQNISSAKTTLIFEGNRVFSERDLRSITEKCLAADDHWKGRYRSETLDYCLSRLKLFLAANGYLQSNIGERKEQEVETGLRVTVPITEGALYRLGEVEITGSKLFAPTQLLEMLTLKHGDIADGESLGAWLYERVGNAYRSFGYIQYTAELEPKFHLKDGAREGIVDLNVAIDEGEAFTIRSIRFEGKGNVSEDALITEMLVRNDDVFNKQLFDDSLKRISQTGEFGVIDPDKDVDYKVDQKNPRLDLIIHLKKKVTTLTPVLRP